MKRIITVYLILILIGVLFGSPENALGQEKSVQTKQPPKLIRYTKKTRVKYKHKKTKLRRKVDLSKVPRVIRP